MPSGRNGHSSGEHERIREEEKKPITFHGYLRTIPTYWVVIVHYKMGTYGRDLRQRLDATGLEFHQGK